MEYIVACNALNSVWCPNAGKNAHAVSVLKRVQMKLEGQEVDGSRYMSRNSEDMS